jgi:hypothetical protein
LEGLDLIGRVQVGPYCNIKRDRGISELVGDISVDDLVCFHKQKEGTGELDPGQRSGSAKYRSGASTQRSFLEDPKPSPVRTAYYLVQSAPRTLTKVLGVSVESAVALLGLGCFDCGMALPPSA